MKPNAWIVVIADEDDVIDSATASRVAVFEAVGGDLDLEEGGFYVSQSRGPRLAHGS